jgi:signal transduction histidine kinase
MKLNTKFDILRPFNSLPTYLVHPELRKPKHPNYLKAKIMSWALLVVFISLPIYCGYFLLKHPEDTIKNYNNLYGTINFIVALLFLRFSSNINNAISVMLYSGFPTVMISIYFTGGLFSSDMIWLLCYVIGAFIFVDTKNGLINATISLVFVLVLFFYTDEEKDQMFKTYVLTHGAEHSLIAFCTVLFLIAGLLTSYNRTLAKANQEIARLNKKQITDLQQEVWLKVQELSNVRKDLSKDFHDEMGNKLASISILSQAALVTLQSENDKSRLPSLLTKIAFNARDVLHRTKDFIWSVDFKSQYVYEFFIYIRAFGGQFFQNIEINFHSDINMNENSQLRLPLQTGRQLMYICKEIMTNAAKHSQCKKVSFVVSHEANNLKIEITDNGNGFDVNKVAKRGLNNIFQRSNDAQIDLTLESNAEGTKFSLNLPLELT